MFNKLLDDDKRGMVILCKLSTETFDSFVVYLTVNQFQQRFILQDRREKAPVSMKVIIKGRILTGERDIKEYGHFCGFFPLI